MEIFLVILLVAVVFILVVSTLRRYINKTNELAKKVVELKVDLEAEIGELRREINSPEPRTEPPPALPVATRQVKEVPQAAPAQPQATVVSRPVAPAPPSRTREEWEALIGGQWLNRIGALALIIGIGFFLKYAFDNDWITESVRVLIGCAAGGGLLLGGARAFKRGLQIFAQGLVGAGIPVLYLSVYASFNFYHLVAQGVAFVLIAAVTMLAFQQAFKYDSLAVSFLGWAGGFLTPFLLSTGQANEVGLFTYIALLVAGLLVVLYRKESWVVLEPFTLGATYLVYLLWHLEYYAPDDLLLTVLFVSVFWSLFYGLDLSRSGRSTLAYAEIRQGSAVFNAAFYFVAMYALITPQHHEWMGLIALGIGAVYLLSALASRRRRAGNALTFARYLLTAIALLVLATSIQFSGYTTVVYWALEGLILVGCGIHWKLRYVWQTALGLFGLAFFKLLGTEGALGYTPIEDFTILLNLRALALAVLAAVLGASVVLFKRLNEPSSALIREVLHYGWCLLLFALCTLEINDYFRQLMAATQGTSTGLSFERSMILATTWLVYSLPLARAGLRKNSLPVLYSSLVALLLATVLAGFRGLAFAPIEEFTPLVNLRFLVLVLVMAGLWIQTRWLGVGHQDHAWMSDIVRVLQVVLALLVLALISAETRDFFERAIFFSKKTTGAASQLKHLANIKHLALSGGWLAYSIVLMVLGLWRRKAEPRLVALVLFGLTILKIFVYDLSFLDTLYRIFSFMGLGIILLAVSYLYQRYKAVIFSPS